MLSARLTSRLYKRRPVSSSSFISHELTKQYQSICITSSTIRFNVMAPKTTQPSLRIPAAPKKTKKYGRPAVTASKKSLNFLPRMPSAPVKRQKKLCPHQMLPDASCKVRKCLLWDLVFSQYSPLRSSGDCSPVRSSTPPSEVTAAPVKQRINSSTPSAMCKRQLYF